MPLNVAVQMDPIERINIRGDSTFALLLEAQARRHTLAYYTPDRMALRGDEVFATVPSGALAVRDTEGDHFTLGEEKRVALRSFDVILMRQGPPSRPRLHHGDASARAHWPRHAGRERPGQRAQRAPEKVFVTRFPDLMPPTLITRDLAEIKAFRAEHGDIGMKPLSGHGGGAVFPHHGRRPQLRLSSTTCSP